MTGSSTGTPVRRPPGWSPTSTASTKARRAGCRTWHVVIKGATPVLTPAETRSLLDGIDPESQVQRLVRLTLA